MLSDDEIKASILFKLHKRGNWGASHTAFENLQKGFKEADLGKHGKKRIETIAKDLIGNNIRNRRRTNSNTHTNCYTYKPSNHSRPNDLHSYWRSSYDHYNSHSHSTNPQKTPIKGENK